MRNFVGIDVLRSSEPSTQIAERLIADKPLIDKGVVAVVSLRSALPRVSPSPVDRDDTDDYDPAAFPYASLRLRKFSRETTS